MGEQVLPQRPFSLGHGHPRRFRWYGNGRRPAGNSGAALGAASDKTERGGPETKKEGEAERLPL